MFNILFLLVYLQCNRLCLVLVFNARNYWTVVAKVSNK